MTLTIETLPLEIAFMILDYCDARSLVNLLCTTKSVNKLARLILDDKVRYVLDNPSSNGLLIKTFAPSDSLARRNGFKTSYVSPIKSQFEASDKLQLADSLSDKTIPKPLETYSNDKIQNNYGSESQFYKSSKSQFIIKECCTCRGEAYQRAPSYANPKQFDFLERSPDLNRGADSSIVVLEICPEFEVFGQFDLAFELELDCYNNIPITIISQNIKLYTENPIQEYKFPSMGISFKLKMLIDESLGKHKNSCGEKVCNYHVQIFDISINSAYLLNRIEPHLKKTGSFVTDIDYHRIDVDATHYRSAQAA
ncbi:hypothetical protein NADFUDRAFT_81239 [Nadsonia fulvescens var. elongata DSM 6958]|uniref:F-box domain-containing protein n=1 Tax=Nadsonia fulvescens var. elongata DSM 6958 TaxID=857566 RepID=A0A1E3PSF3_9ASCO|nr:hypothetical protein NADFUDRAFT_81239 [Nadsonia fulvescens var. elongata DSM 6958]